MDDLVQVLIFIVTFVIFIVSAVRKQKKRPAPNPGMDDAFESLFGVSQLSEVDSFETKEAAVQPPAKVTKKQVPKSVLPEEGIKAIPNQPIIADDNTVESEPGHQSFDLREAVIYQTILTRKDF